MGESLHLPRGWPRAGAAGRGHRPGHSPAARSARQYRSQIT